MKILFVTPGSGDGYFCGNCYRDNLMAQALHRAGHEVTVVPLYLPLKHIGELQGNAPLFFPANSFFVEQLLHARMPNWVKKALDSKWALDKAAKMAGTTSSEGMEGMTFSMIEGEDKVFLRHMRKLIEWVQTEQPEVVHLSSSLLLGIARRLKEEIHIPIVCSLQDEEVWIDGLEPDDARRAWNSIGEGAKWVDRFVTSSVYYQRMVSQRLTGFPHVQVIYPGVDIAKYKTDEWPDKPTIGFFYRMNQLDGLDILADAFVLMKRRNTIPRLQLRIGGGYMVTDRAFLGQVWEKLKPFADDVTIEEDYTWKRHADFYRHITVLAVPLRFCEGVGLYLCEAFAAGRPAVEPRTGSFEEIIGDAGLTYEPNTPEVLAETLEQLLTDKQLLTSCARHATRMSRTRYDDRLNAQQLEQVYRQVLG